MKNHRLKVMAMSVVLSTGVLATAFHAVANVDSVLQAGAQKLEQAKASQARVDTLADQAYNLLQEFKTVNKQIEGLEVYNAQLERQVANQNQSLADLQESIENATVMERQIVPLTIRMLDALEQFVKLDLPFNREDRLKSVQRVRANLDRAEFSAAEKFRQVLELYDIESQYSRTVEHYEGLLDSNGDERQVNFFRVGRIALMYQTPDLRETGVWDAESSSWQVANGFRNSVSKGIRIAKQQAAIDILALPIPAPETAQ